MSTAPSLTAPSLRERVADRLAERRREAQRRQELQTALAGDHGPGVRAEVLAAMQR